MSLIKYNGVTLPYCYFTTFDQQAVYDDLADTDWQGTKFDIVAQAVLNANYASVLAPSLASVSPKLPAAAFMSAIRDRLLIPRRDLSVTFNGFELIPKVTGNVGNVDAANGPKPQSCRIDQLTDETFLITYHVTAQYWERTKITATPTQPVTNSPIASPVLFNRWTESVDIDELGLSKRTRDGKCKIRSDNDLGFTADQLREAMCVTGVPEGFLRKSSRYTVTPDGLGVQYQVIDEEQYKMPPPPAFQADGETLLTGTGPAGAIRHCQVRVVLRGQKKSGDQDKMLLQAIYIAMNKMNRIGGNGFAGGGGANNQGQQGILENIMVRTALYRNEVEVTVRGMLPANQNTVAGVGVNLKNMNYTPVVTPVATPAGVLPLLNSEQGTVTDPPPYEARGSANVFLQAAAYFDPNLTGVTFNPSTGQFSRGLVPGQAGKTLEPEALPPP